MTIDAKTPLTIPAVPEQTFRQLRIGDRYFTQADGGGFAIRATVIQCNDDGKGITDAPMPPMVVQFAIEKDQAAKLAEVLQFLDPVIFEAFQAQQDAKEKGAI